MISVTEETILHQIEEVDNDINAIKEKIKPFQEQLDAKQSCRKELLAQLDAAWVDRLEKAELNWDQILRGAERGVKMYEYRKETVGMHLGMTISGTWTDTEEQALEIKIGRNDESEQKALAAIRTIIPFMRPHDEDGRIWFGIFEHTLSADGIYLLKINKDFKSATVTKTTYGHERDVASFLALEDAVHYIRQNHWYDEDGDVNED